MFRFTLPAVTYVAPLSEPLADRLALLARGTRRIAYFYDRPDTSTFRYRALNMIEALKIVEPSASASWFALDDFAQIDAILSRADIVVACRMQYSDSFARLLGGAHARGLQVLFDIDDMVFDDRFVHLILDTLDQQRRDEDWNFWFAYIGRMGAAMRLCDGAILTNSYLANRANAFSGLPTAIVPNFLNAAQLRESQRILEAKQKNEFRRDGRIHLGYFSGTPTHKRDFAIASDAIARVMERDPRVVLRIVGFLEPTGALAKLRNRIEIFPLQDILNLQRLIGEVEINIVPLQDNAFTNCKSELKVFEASVVGTISLASPSFTLRQAIQHGETGFLVPSHGWEEAIGAAIAILPEYPAMAQAAAAAALDRYTPTYQSAAVKDAVITGTPWLQTGKVVSSAGADREPHQITPSIPAVLISAAPMVGQTRTVPSHEPAGNDLSRQVALALREVAALRQRDAILYSTTWRATRPLRFVGGKLPTSVRRALQHAARLVYWTFTLQVRRRLRLDQASRQTIFRPHAELRQHSVEDPYQRWILECDTLSDRDRGAIARHIAELERQPLISVIMPCFETPEPILRAAIASVQSQTYPHWELCIADDASRSPHVGAVLCELAEADSRIKWMRREVNGHIALATNSALSLATGEFIALMDHDDLLAETALYEIAVELNLHPNTDLLYSDSDAIDGDGHRHTPYFKSDWSPDLFLSHNMFSHLGVIGNRLVREIGGLREGLEGSQDYDLVLRAAARTDLSKIRHIPAVLYHWRQDKHKASFSQSHLDRCVAAAQVAVQESLEKRGGHAAAPEVVPADAGPQYQRVRWPLPNPQPRVTVIVSSRDHADLLERCTAGVLNRTNHDDVELFVLVNEAVPASTLAWLCHLEQDPRVRIWKYESDVGYPATFLAAISTAAGSVVLLLDDCIDVIHDDWLREMVSHALRPEVGAVGAKLLAADGTIQHAGMVLGIEPSNVAVNFGLGQPRNANGYFDYLVLARDVSAVSGACLAIRKDLLEAVGGLDHENLPKSFSDVDLCLRLRAQGLRIIFTPFAELYHTKPLRDHSSATPEETKQLEAECRYMRRRWGATLDNDPFYNANFSRANPNLSLAIPARRVKPWQRHL